MSAPIICPTCQTVQEHCIEIDSERVCSSCGNSIVKQFEQHTETTYIVGDKLPIRLSKAKKSAIEKLKCVAEHFQLTQVNIDNAIDLFNEHYDDKEFKFKQASFKEVMAGVCIFIVANGIIKIDIIKHLNCSLKEFNTIYNKMKPNVDSSAISADAIVEEEERETSVQQAKVEDFLQGFDFGSDTKNTVERTVELLKMADDFCLTIGKSLDPIIGVLAYFSWKSFNLNTKGSFLKFCRDFKFGPNVSRCSSFTLIQTWLISLAQQLGWIQRADEVTKKNVHRFVRDIVEFNLMLKCKIVREEFNLDPHSQSDQSEIQRQFYLKYRRPETEKKHPPRRESARQSSYSSDIDDEEIDTYIRTSAEVKAYEDMLNKL